MNTSLIGLEAANKMLPFLKSIVKDIVKLWDSIIKQRKVFEETKAKGEYTKDIKSSLNDLIDTINQYIKEVESLGCFIEEFKRGIVNIPSLCCGRKIFLTIQPMEEAEIGFWHELDETSADKQPIGKLNILE